MIMMMTVLMMLMMMTVDEDDEVFFLQKCMVAVCQIVNISELLFPSSQINTYAHAITYIYHTKVHMMMTMMKIMLNTNSHGDFEGDDLGDDDGDNDDDSCDYDYDADHKRHIYFVKIDHNFIQTRLLGNFIMMMMTIISMIRMMIRGLQTLSGCTRRSLLRSSKSAESIPWW